MARQSGTPLSRTETQQSVLSNTHQISTPVTSTKRPSSPDHRKREEPRATGDYGPPAHKRPRPLSPPRERERERWDGPSRRRFGSPPAWERERERDGPPPPPRRPDRDREDEKAVTLPSVITWFVGQLPSASAFDGESTIPLRSCFYHISIITQGQYFELMI
jgi:cleavage stimulation factor subunit 3